jgi:FkbM family methyltransferase
MPKILAKLKDARVWGRSAGWPAALTYAAYRTKMALGLPEPATLSIKPRQAKYPVVVRLRGSSDMEVFGPIFVAEEYACIGEISSPKLVMDLGANVGYSSAYLLSRFPSAAFVAVEPDPDNFKQCRENLAPYGNRVRLVLGGVWSDRSRLVLSRPTFGDGREWAAQVRESDGEDDEATVEGWDIPSLLELAGQEQIDLLKVDIEGSESHLFGSNFSSWLPKVRNICIELHGADCRDVFFNALKNFEYELGFSGDLTICRNLRPKAS